MKKDQNDQIESQKGAVEETLPNWEKPEIRRLPVGLTKGGTATANAPGDDTFYVS